MIKKFYKINFPQMTTRSDGERSLDQGALEKRDVYHC